MKISDIALKRPVTTVMIVLLLVLLGGIGFMRLNLDMFPSMTYPGAAIIMDYDGVGPEEVENMVTRPLESAVSTVTNIETVDSVSSRGQSVVVAQFNWGTDMDMAVMDMRENIDLYSEWFPDEAGNPMIVKFDPSLMPIMQLGVSGDTDLASLKRIIEDRVNPRLERLEGVASVNLTGGTEREILIVFDETKLNNYNIDYSGVINTLAMDNVNISAGNVERGNKELLVRVIGQFDSVDEIRDLLVHQGSGQTVKLSEIAEVRDTYKEMQSISRLDGQSSISLSIQKETDANTVRVSNRVMDEIEEIKEEIGGLVMVPVFDQAEIIETSVGNIGMNALFGGILAILILLLFLKSIRSTLIIATAIPVSVITTFMLLYFGNLTLNMMTLGGIALGVGMLVDNSIVVLENIYRYRIEGLGLWEAASKGSSEIGMAIVASTITTMVVFLPVVFIEGIASELFRELALTVSFSLLASLAVSLTLIPVMSSKLLKVDREKKENGFVVKLRNIYSSCLKWCMARRGLVVGITLGIFVLTLGLMAFVGSEFIPEMDQGEFTVEAQLPMGTSLEETDRISTRIENMIQDIPEVESLLLNVGTGGDMMGMGGEPERAIFYVRLVDGGQRRRTTNDIMEELRNEINIPDTEITIQASDAMGADDVMGGSAIALQIRGDDLEILESLALQVREEIEKVEGTREVGDSISEGRPEMQINLNRALAAEFGLRAGQVGSILETAISGQTATRYEVGGQEYDVRVRLAEDRVETPEQLRQLLIPNQAGARISLEQIADFRVEEGPREILRQNQQRYVNVTSDLYERDIGAAMNEIEERIDENINLPAGYRIEYGGEYDQMMESFVQLGYAIILALILVYMVMASQFESLFHPFIIMFTVPLALIGVVWGLFVTGYNLSVVSIIGVTVLAGIVVNNAIVLVDYINTLRSRDGKSLNKAVIEAGRVRMRPILMTALTTILALLPLAFGIGEGTEIQAPMAVVVVGGLTVATLLTLFIIPVTYSLLADLKYKIVGRGEDKEVSV